MLFRSPSGAPSGAPSGVSAGPPPELLRMPADASEFSFLRSGAGVSAALIGQLAEGLKAFGGTAWSATDLSKLEAELLALR